MARTNKAKEIKMRKIFVVITKPIKISVEVFKFGRLTIDIGNFYIDIGHVPGEEFRLFQINLLEFNRYYGITIFQLQFIKAVFTAGFK